MTQPKESVYTIVFTKIDDALKELASSKPKAAPLLEALQVAQSYLLTLPQGADRKILDRINDAIKKPSKPQELKETFESLQAYLLTSKVPDEPDNGMKCTITLRRCDDTETLSLTLSVFPAAEFKQLIDIVDKFIQDKIIDCTNGEM